MYSCRSQCRHFLRDVCFNSDPEFRDHFSFNNNYIIITMGLKLRIQKLQQYLDKSQQNKREIQSEILRLKLLTTAKSNKS